MTIVKPWFQNFVPKIPKALPQLSPNKFKDPISHLSLHWDMG